MQVVVEKIKRTIKILKRVISRNKKTILIYLCIGVCLYLRIKYFPRMMQSSDFLNLLKKNRIDNVSTLDNNMVFFKYPNSNKQFFCHYFIQNMDNFNKELHDRGIKFINYSNYYAFVINPIYQLNSLVVLMAYKLSSTVKK